MNVGTYTRFTPIHTSQFSSNFRVIIHCATRLTEVRPASRYGTGESVCVAMNAPRPIANAVASGTLTSQCSRRACVTCSAECCAPPYSHSYQPYTERTRYTSCSTASAYSLLCQKTKK